MKIKLNGSDFDFQIENEVTVGEVLGKVEEACGQQKSTIIEVCLNGKTLKADELDFLFAKSVKEDLTVELFTINKDGIRLYLKDLAKNFIGNAEDLEKVPVKMQTGKDGEVISLIENFSVNLTHLYNTIKLFDVADIPQDYKFGDKTIVEYQKQISEFLDIIISALENKDTIEVSDIAEYELSPLVKDLGNGLLSLDISKN